MSLKLTIAIYFTSVAPKSKLSKPFYFTMVTRIRISETIITSPTILHETIVSILEAHVDKVNVEPN